MVINGRPGLACRTLTQNLGPEITLAPLPVFELIADLSVNTGKWMRAMSERLQAWVHMKEEEVDISRLEERMEPELAQKIYELDRCIECGCCVAGCGTARMREDFVGAVGLNKIARFRLDPRDSRTDDDFYELVGDDDGRVRLHVVARLPRRMSQAAAACDADRVRAAQDGQHGVEVAEKGAWLRASHGRLARAGALPMGRGAKATMRRTEILIFGASLGAEQWIGVPEKCGIDDLPVVSGEVPFRKRYHVAFLETHVVPVKGRKAGHPSGEFRKRGRAAFPIALEHAAQVA